MKINITKDIVGFTGHQVGNSKLLLSLGLDNEGRVNEDFFPIGTLIAGGTGSGRSLYMETMVLDLASRYSCKELQLILVDSKRVQFPHFAGLPHLMCPIIQQENAFKILLRWLSEELERRKELLLNSKTRYTEAYNKTFKNDQLPYILLIVDELPVMMLDEPSYVERALSKLLSLSKNMGVHIVLSSQRPQKEVFTATLKNSSSAVISFHLATESDSVTFLGASGAEKLKGKGEMLYVLGNHKPLKLKTSFLTQEQLGTGIEGLTDHSACYYNEILLDHLINGTSKH